MSLPQDQRTFGVLMLHVVKVRPIERPLLHKARLLVEQITTSLLPQILSIHPDSLEFIFPDGPRRFGTAIDNSTGDGEHSQSETGLESRGWWLDLNDYSRYVGLENSLIRLSESLDNRPIHAVAAFSQGAALAAMISGLCDASSNTTRRALLAENGIPVETFLKNLRNQQPLVFAICISGYRGSMKYCSPFYAGTLSTPSLHVIARLDTTIPAYKT
ncbi:serine hydrolase-domain-containing protein [Aspergillus pseudoustus]|uniref:Serine hydrolase-domain-containing protein n=1 Tax=Aspergillus pseudoustus TaxID=1810923 RepID=A0ABR4JH95_9EURO